MKRARNDSSIYSVRLSEVDKAAFRRAAAAAGVPRSRFLRELLDGAIRAYRVYQPDENQLKLF